MAAGSWVRFYIEAAANNPAKSVVYSPVGAEHDVYLYQIAPKQATNPDLIQLITVEGAGHIESYDVDRQGYVDSVVAFLAELD